MLTYKDFKIIRIDEDFMKHLYEICNEVFYLPREYETKPYLGVLINQNGREYAIPFSSAKQKHLKLKNHDNGFIVVYENIKKASLKPGMIFAKNIDGTFKHFLSVLCLLKMVPVRKDLYSVVDINFSPNDDPDTRNYKNLLNKEFSFCISNKERIRKEAEAIYDKQIKTGKVSYKYVDFRKLEAACDKYQKN